MNTEKKVSYDMNILLKNNHIKTCPIGCTSELATTDIMMPEGPLLKCTACGQLLSQCSEDGYWKSMEEFNDPRGTLPNERSIKRRLRRSKKFLDGVSALLGKPPAAVRILDVGCSSGAFVSAGVQLGYRAEGVEPAAKAATTAQAAGLTVRQGMLHEVGYADGEFDAVALLEVIEHLKEPLSLLKECHRVLRPGGILVIGTANAASWTASAFGAHWDYLSIAKHGGHISFYSPDSLENLAKQAGFTMAALKTRSVRFSDRDNSSEPFYSLLKIAGELLNPLATLLHKGSDMAMYLRRE